MEAQYHVLHLESPEELPEEHDGDLAHVVAVFYGGAFLAVAGWHGNVHGAEAKGVQLYQHIVAVAVVGVEIVQVHVGEGLAGDGCVAVLGVHDVPVTAGYLGDHGEQAVAKCTPFAHAHTELLAEQAVAFGVIGLAFDYWHQ